jgi:hypothetical protein
MQASGTKAHVSKYVTEDKYFWQNHLSKFRESGLTRKHYCRQNAISYDRFTYWIRKHPQQPQVFSEQKEKLEKPRQFLPLQLKPEHKPDSTSLFSLNLKNGCVLQIHNEQALSIILEKLS